MSVDQQMDFSMNNQFIKMRESIIECLTTDSVVELKFFNNPITIWKRRLRDKSFRFMVSPVDLKHRESESMDMQIDEETNSIDTSQWHLIEISVMNDDECSFKKQESFGHLYNSSDFVTFRARVDDYEKTGYKIELFLETTADGETGNVNQKEHSGFCYLLPVNMKESNGTFTMPITGNKNQPIGQLTVEYLIIKPLKNIQTNNSELKYARLWNPIRTGFDIGHRGAGNARRTDKVENVLENTVASFNYASKHGADMVELDVQLSKDKVPVIYHDYSVNLLMKKKRETDHEFLQIAVKDLTQQQLQLLKLSPVHKENKTRYDFEDDTTDNQPFPTLKHVLEAVDQHCGFNVEIKYPQRKHDGFEAEISVDINEYIDIILKTIFENSGSRYIMLSCFHPDMCSIIRLKQNRYPLLFLTQGLTKKWQPFVDPRTSSIQMATYFARSIGILGINVHAEDILHERSLIRFVKSRGLVLFCWGEDLNKTDIIEELKKDGVDGVVYDKIDEYGSKELFVAKQNEGRKQLLEIITGQSSESITSWGSSVSLA